MDADSHRDCGPSSPVTEQVLIALRRISRAIDLHSRTLASRFGVTGPQLVLLKELARRETCSISELARSVNLSQATVSGIVDRLMKQGLIERIRDAVDRRRVLVLPTQKVHELLLQTPPLMQEHFTAKFERLKDWEQSQILSSLQRIVSMMESPDFDISTLLDTDFEQPGEDMPGSLPQMDQSRTFEPTSNAPASHSFPEDAAGRGD